MTWCSCSTPRRPHCRRVRNPHMATNVKAQTIGELMDGLGRAATQAAAVLAHTPREQKDRALSAAAGAVRAASAAILEANGRDLAAARAAHMSAARLERL